MNCSRYRKNRPRNNNYNKSNKNTWGIISYMQPAVLRKQFVNAVTHTDQSFTRALVHYWFGHTSTKYLRHLNLPNSGTLGKCKACGENKLARRPAGKMLSDDPSVYPNPTMPFEKISLEIGGHDEGVGYGGI